MNTGIFLSLTKDDHEL
uniref:Uncharacterized protein n=1 Tax=Arundo donax TaxID=35708 RepID=A0A0A8ZF47_ARUDO